MTETLINKMLKQQEQGSDDQVVAASRETTKTTTAAKPAKRRGRRMAKPDEKHVTVSVALPPDMFDIVDKIIADNRQAWKEPNTFSSFIRQAVGDYLNRMGFTAKAHEKTD